MSRPAVFRGAGRQHRKYPSAYIVIAGGRVPKLRKGPGYRLQVLSRACLLQHGLRALHRYPSRIVHAAVQQYRVRLADLAGAGCFFNIAQRPVLMAIFRRLRLTPYASVRCVAGTVLQPVPGPAVRQGHVQCLCKHADSLPRCRR